MQLKNIKLNRERMSPTRKALSAATSALLGGIAPGIGNAADSESSWEFDAAVLYYGEGDGRVQALEPMVKAKKDLGDGESLDLKLVVDSLTGSSPSGAAPSSQIQTFTRPSGNGSYTVAAGEVPLDDTFHDTRVALSGNWDKPVSRLSKLNLGANFSKEYDFQSLGLSASFSHDFNQRNTTLSAGIAMEFNELDPEGGIPVELTNVNDARTITRREDTDDRDQIDLLLGLTQVISQRTIMQFNISHSESDGYHSDPFKIVSIVDTAAGPNQGDPIYHIYENRPDSRSKTALFWQTRHSFDKDAVDFSYRYMSDDWGIDSHTLDLSYYWMTDGDSYWQPSIRLYQQNAADFYRTLLPDSEPIPTYVSADYRLGEMTSITYGIKYSKALPKDRRMEFRLGLMTQSNDPSPGSRIGNQANRELVLDTEAVMFQFTYSF